ncbi:MAG TPA: hypothetical protein VGH74_11235 [Planctomycetaceae bacterium]|jgi:hypothetical protein
MINRNVANFMPPRQLSPESLAAEPEIRAAPLRIVIARKSGKTPTGVACPAQPHHVLPGPAAMLIIRTEVVTAF